MTEVDLLELGLRTGERVRFRRPDRARWQNGTVRRRESDGSIRVIDEQGATRTVPVGSVEVKRPGPRGASGWEPLTDRAGRHEQLDLLGGP